MAYHVCLPQPNADHYSPAKLDCSLSVFSSTVPMDIQIASMAWYVYFHLIWLWGG